jgi:tetratricopeptide (TPR) repeat protein
MFGQSPKPPAGFIKYFGLTDWWLATFTEEEREKIVSTFQPLGLSPDPLIVGDITHASGSAAGLLSALAGWFRKREYKSIAFRIIEKAEELAPQAGVLERHFLYHAKIRTYYPFRDEDDFALPRAIEACEQQINMSLEAAKIFREKYRGDLPAHTGYQQLAILREKQGDFESAINLSQKAFEEGWSGDWENRIERCKKKAAKQAATSY